MVYVEENCLFFYSSSKSSSSKPSSSRPMPASKKAEAEAKLQKAAKAGKESSSKSHSEGTKINCPNLDSCITCRYYILNDVSIF